MAKAIRFGVVGGVRGRAFRDCLKILNLNAQLTAICDIDQQALRQWREQDQETACYTDLKRMLGDDICDAVVIATPMQVHTEQSILALQAGKHVLCDVPACLSDAEARQLIAVARRSSGIYMMGENYGFTRPQLTVEQMVKQGVFGELTYVEGMYIHDCRALFFLPDGSLTWRSEVHGKWPGNTYPTHPMGPVARWLGLGEDDVMESLYCTASPPLGLADFALREFGPQHPAANPRAWVHGDCAPCLIRTRKGRVIYLRMDISSNRPRQAGKLELQGTRAAYTKTHDEKDMGLVWIDGRSPGRVLPLKEEMNTYYKPRCEWEPLSKYAAEYEHPLWRRWGAKAQGTSHDGGDVIMTAEFIRAIEQRSRPAVDIYDAVAWSSIVWMSGESQRTGEAVKAFDYRKL